jgi:glycosyltransferase involved in cell wall biosynthesis
VTLVTLADPHTDFFAPPPSVTRLGLGFDPLRRGTVENIRRVMALRRALVSVRPDVTISFLTTTNILTILAVAGTGIPAVATARIARGHLPLGPFWTPLERLTYPLASRLVSVSAGVDAGYSWLSPARRAVILSPIAPEFERAPRRDHRAGATRRTIITAGRLVPQKGFDLLLPAFARIAGRWTDWDLVVLGEGPERAALEAQRRRLGLDARVAFPGAVEDVAARLGAADLFVSSSRFEGFSCAVIEALAVGLPVVATDCPGGTAEVVRHEENGLLLAPDDEEGLASAMERLVGDDEYRHRLGEAACRVREHLNVERVVPAWESLFGEILA